MSLPLNELIDINMLIKVQVKRAACSIRQGSATLITEVLYSLLVEYAGNTDLDQGYSALSFDVLLELTQFTSEEPINPLLVPE